MKLRTDLPEHLTADDILEEAVATVHRFKPEPRLSKTGTGSLSPASTEERANEEKLSSDIAKKLTSESDKSGNKSARKK